MYINISHRLELGSEYLCWCIDVLIKKMPAEMYEFSKSRIWVHYAHFLYGELTIFKVILGATKNNITAKCENIF